jgi:hypothetical protein
MDKIKEIIEEEIEARVNQRVTELLEYISDRWDISLALLTKEIPKALPKTNVTQCMSVHKKTKKRCRNRPKENGFCHLHQGQALEKKSSHETTEQHTHTLPPFFLKGCPVCDKANRFRDFDDIECT